MAKICIDAGHGGSDPGAVGHGRLEKDDALNLSIAVGGKLQELGHTIVYTRTTDVYEGVNQKAADGNACGADLYLSNHRNAASVTANGNETLVYKTSGAAYVIATNINAKMKALGFRNRGVKVRQDLAVLRQTNMPALLTETGFITNADDNAKWVSNFDAIAKCIADSINDYYGGKSTVVSTPVNPAPVNPAPSVSAGDNWILRLQKECNKQGFSNQPEDNIKGPKTLAGCPLLKQGHQGNITKLMQERLESFGYELGAQDGVFGPQTKAAVIMFQKTEGLVADGIVGPKTWAELLGL